MSWATSAPDGFNNSQIAALQRSAPVRLRRKIGAANIIFNAHAACDRRLWIGDPGCDRKSSRRPLLYDQNNVNGCATAIGAFKRKSLDWRSGSRTECPGSPNRAERATAEAESTAQVSILSIAHAARMARKSKFLAQNILL